MKLIISKATIHCVNGDFDTDVVIAKDLRAWILRFSAYDALERHEHLFLAGDSDPSWKDFDKLIRKELLAELEEVRK